MMAFEPLDTKNTNSLITKITLLLTAQTDKLQTTAQNLTKALKARKEFKRIKRK